MVSGPSGPVEGPQAPLLRSKWPAPAGKLSRPGLSWVHPINSAGRTCKPNSVVCGHSSRRRVAADAHQRPTRRFRQLLRAAWAHRADAQRCMTRCKRFPPYLVLLRVGFTLPPALPPERCALAAPFHPYPGAGVPQRRAYPASRANSGIAFPGRPSNRIRRSGKG
jgi:hypothetical protein